MRIKRIFKSLTIVWSVMAAASSPVSAQTVTAADTLRLSARQCVEIAMTESPTVKVADLEVKRMDYSKKEVLASLFPSIDFSGAYQRSIELQTISMNMGGQSQRFKMGTDNVWNFGFQAAMPIVNAQLWKSISLSDTQILQSFESARASRLDLAAGINKAYYALQLALDSRQVIKQNYDLACFNANLYQRQYEQGTASEYDVLRSSVQVKNVEPEMLQADIAVKQCQLQLKVLMGIDAAVTVMPSETLEDMKGMMRRAPETYASLNGNTTLRTLDISRKLAKQNLTLQKLAWVPSIGAAYNINWNAMSNGNALRNQIFNPYSTVALSLSVPIFSGGAKYQKVRQAKVQLREIEFQRENLVNSLNMQVELAIDNINKQVAQIASSEEGVRQAAKALEIMQKSFEIGAAPYLSLRDSELANTAARLAYYQSIYNYLVSTADLHSLLGNEEELGITQSNK